MSATRSTTLAGAALALLLAVSACSTAGDDGAAAGSTAPSAAPPAVAKFLTAPTELPVTAPLAAAPPTGVAVTFLSNGLPITQIFNDGLAAAAKALGWSLTTLTFDQSNPATGTSAFETALNSGAKVIVLNGLPSQLYAPLVPKAKAQGVTIVDGLSSDPEIDGVTYVDRTEAGAPQIARIAVAAVVADAAARGVTPHMVSISSPLFASLLKPVNDGLTAQLAAAGCGSCDLAVFDLSPEATVSQATAAPIVSYLQSHPEVNYVFSASGAIVSGLLPAMTQAGLSKDIRLIGVAPTDQEIDDLKAGQPQTLGWISNNVTGVHAWMMMDAAARVSVGTSAAEYADVTAPAWLLTSASGAQLVADPVAPRDYQDQFRKLWSRDGS